MSPQKSADEGMPLFSNHPATNLVNANTGEPVTADSDPSIQVVRANVDRSDPHKRLVGVELGHLVVEGGGFLGDAAPGVTRTVAGDVVAIDPVGSATTLQRSPQ